MNVTFIFLSENLHGHFEGNLCLMYGVTILLSFSIFTEFSEDSFGYAFSICSTGISKILPWYITIYFERLSLLSLKLLHIPLLTTRYVDHMWLNQRRNKI